MLYTLVEYSSLSDHHYSSSSFWTVIFKICHFHTILLVPCATSMNHKVQPSSQWPGLIPLQHLLLLVVTSSTGHCRWNLVFLPQHITTSWCQVHVHLTCWNFNMLRSVDTFSCFSFNIRSVHFWLLSLHASHNPWMDWNTETCVKSKYSIPLCWIKFLQ